MHNQTVVSFVIIIIIDKQVFLHSARFAFGLASQDGDESSLAEAAESQRFVAVGVSGRVELPSSVSLSLSPFSGRTHVNYSSSSQRACECSQKPPLKCLIILVRSISTSSSCLPWLRGHLISQTPTLPGSTCLICSIGASAPARELAVSRLCALLNSSANSARRRPVMTRKRGKCARERQRTLKSSVS